jgi:NADH dehydrogenase [ubiquinone] 1 alpha subcomplex assembly factor 5
MSDAITVFDHRTLRRRRERAARTGSAEFLFVEAAERLAERLEDINRIFPRALDLGSRDGLMAKAVGSGAGGTRGGIVELVQADPAPGFAARAGGLRLAADPEFLPFAPASFDAVLSALALHWVNDLPGALLQLRRVLKPDGLLLASMLGGETLTELRQALVEAEIAEEGGLSPRVSPFADSRDLGGLLQRAGFALPVVDSDRITVTYPDALALMRELRAMGESNAVVERRRSVSRRATLLRAAVLYAERFGHPDGRIPATFEIITLTGWAPHESQQKPLRPGSATTRLASALGGTEKSAGEKARSG